MNHKITILVLLGLIAWSCSQETKIEFSSESFTEKDLAICKGGGCPEVTINYIQIFGDKKVSEKINNRIQHFIIASLLMGEDSIPTAKTIDEAATEFIDAYKADKAQFQDMTGEYFAEITVNEIYSSPDLISFEMRQYLFTGGAHGYGTTSFLNIDPKTGEQLKGKEIFNDKKGFTELAEKEFRIQQKIAQDESINETGFWFEEDVFYLPESVGFTFDSLIFIYNQYDIASYADGPIELKIAKKEAEPFLRIH